MGVISWEEKTLSWQNYTLLYQLLQKYTKKFLFMLFFDLYIAISYSQNTRNPTKTTVFVSNTTLFRAKIPFQCLEIPFSLLKTFVLACMRGLDLGRRKTSPKKLTKFSAEVGEVLCRSWRSSLQKLAKFTAEVGKVGSWERALYL